MAVGESDSLRTGFLMAEMLICHPHGLASDWGSGSQEGGQALSCDICLSPVAERLLGLPSSRCQHLWLPFTSVWFQLLLKVPGINHSEVGCFHTLAFHLTLTWRQNTRKPPLVIN